MNAIVFKYIQVFCVAFLFDSIDCDHLRLESAADDVMLNRFTGCTANCMGISESQNLIECYQECLNQKQYVAEPLKQTQSTETMRLICRDSDSLTIEIVSEFIHQNISANIKETTIYNNELYLIKLQANDDQLPQKIGYIADSSIIRIENIANSTSYNVTASIFTNNFEYRHLPVMGVFRTLDTDMYIPDTISNTSITLDNFAVDGNNTKELLTTVHWQPAEDMVCRYSVHIYSTEDKHSDAMTEFPIYRQLYKPEELYSFEIESLQFDTEYNMNIRGINTKNDHIEGNLTSFVFRTPTCWTFYNYDLTKCPPLPISNLTSTHGLISKDYYAINVTWSMPKHLPDYYVVSVNTGNYYSKDDSVTKNVSGSQSNAYFPEVYITDIYYHVSIEAVSKGGRTDESKFDISLKQIYKGFFDKSETTEKVIGIMVLIIVLLIIAFVLYCCIQTHRKNENYCNKIYFQKIAQSLNKDKLAVLPSDVQLHHVLGEGAFGIVRKGFLMTSNQAVAVKMLKDNASKDDELGFFREIDLMRSVGQHENIVAMIGHHIDVDNKKNMMLLIEFCDEGNLLDYLRDYRQHWPYQQTYSTIQIVSEPIIHNTLSYAFDKSPENVFNLNSSIADKLSPKEKTISLLSGSQGSLSTILLTNDLKNKLPETNMQNIIFNKLYDELTVDNNNLQKLFGCNNSCKCRVEVLSPECSENCTNNNNGLQNDRKCTIKIEDCDCQCVPKQNPNKEPAAVLITENHGYDLIPDDCKYKTNKLENNQQKKGATNEHDKKMDGKGKDLSSKDLLSFSKQIASGMEFLANNKIVHRDLAARNVLVCSDKTAKIADFGLSRDIYKNNIYLKSTAGPLPVKWLALESMIHEEYTSQSDVWSYGILLYEIVSLGCTPYPTVSVEKLLDYLSSGNRMNKPHNCSQEFYDLMFSCWHCEPEERPTFTDIWRKVDYFIKHFEPSDLIKVGFLEKRKRPTDSTGNNNISNFSYLKPL